MLISGIELKTQTTEDPHNYGYLIFNKEARNAHQNKIASLNKWCWSKWMAACGRIQIVLNMLHKIQSDKRKHSK